MSDHRATRRLIESAFPLRETLIDSVHEKNVRHGHISTLLELAEGGSEERSILESIQNHLRAADAGSPRQRAFRLDGHST